MTKNDIIKISGATHNQVNHASKHLGIEGPGKGFVTVFTEEEADKILQWLVNLYGLNFYVIYESKLNFED